MDNKLIEAAWEAREKAYPWKSGTKVGCAIKGSGGDIFVGWNVEGLWMSSIHAEVCAVLQLAGAGQRGVEIVIVADCKRFTACGACVDWLVQFCEPFAEVTSGRGGMDGYTILVLNDLYPMYPKQ